MRCKVLRLLLKSQSPSRPISGISHNELGLRGNAKPADSHSGTGETPLLCAAKRGHVEAPHLSLVTHTFVHYQTPKSLMRHLHAPTVAELVPRKLGLPFLRYSILHTICGIDPGHLCQTAHRHSRSPIMAMTGQLSAVCNRAMKCSFELHDQVAKLLLTSAEAGLSDEHACIEGSANLAA